MFSSWKTPGRPTHIEGPCTHTCPDTDFFATSFKGRHTLKAPSLLVVEPLRGLGGKTPEPQRKKKKNLSMIYKNYQKHKKN